MNPVTPLQSSINTSPDQMDFTTPLIPNFSPNIVSGELSFVSLQNVQCGGYLLRLQRILGDLVRDESNREADNEDVLFSDMTVQPNYWISKWVDDINNYGLGYQLSDDTVGVIFRDGTMLIKPPDKNTIDFYDSKGNVTTTSVEIPSSSVTLKMQFFAYTQNYMATNLVKTGSENSISSDPVLPRPHLHTFWRLKNAVVMHLNDGTLQLNFFDHIKVILCLLKESITFIDEVNRFQSYRFSVLQQEGCPSKFNERLIYAKHVIDEMLQRKFY